MGEQSTLHRATGLNEFSRPQEPFAQARTFWTEAAKNPTSLLKPTPGDCRTAFGNGVKLLVPGTQLRDVIDTKLTDGRTQIAGVQFSGDELTWIAEMYQGIQVHCMDERLDEKTNGSGIHIECGAAGAIGSVIGRTGVEVEDLALELTHGHTKETLIPGMGHHEGITVLTTFGKTPQSVEADQYGHVRNNAALPFHTYIDVEKISTYAQEQGLDRKAVFTALLKWNQQIAINIMKGGHNAYADEVKTHGVIAVLDTRGVDKTQYADLFQVQQEFLASQSIQVTPIEIQ